MNKQNKVVNEEKKESMAEILARMKPQVDKEMQETMERDPNSMRNILKRLKK